MDFRSELASAAALRAQRHFHLDSSLESNRTCPTEAGRVIQTDHAGFHKGIGLSVDCAA